MKEAREEGRRGLRGRNDSIERNMLCSYKCSVMLLQVQCVT